MKCRKCGAVLLDTDTFCVKCGQRVGEPMFCFHCGEQLRDGERFCHKCGSPVETDEEIPLSQQKTVDIPFDQIEQGILMEAEQAIVKRPGTEKAERRNPETYRRPGTEISGGYGYPGEPSGGYRNPEGMSGGYQAPGEPFEGRRLPPQRAAENYQAAEAYRQKPVRDTAYYEDIEKEEPYEAPVRPRRRIEPPRRYEEDYEEYDDDDEEDEDSGDSKMKVITVILGIIVIAIALAIGFILWQRNDPSRYERTEEETGQEEDSGEDDEDGEEGEVSADTAGRIQILSNVNVRTAPSTEGSEVLMVAKQGETYEYYELVDSAWYHIKLEDGSDGYVSSKYVEDLE